MLLLSTSGNIELLRRANAVAIFGWYAHCATIIGSDCALPSTLVLDLLSLSFVVQQSEIMDDCLPDSCKFVLGIKTRPPENLLKTLLHHHAAAK